MRKKNTSDRKKLKTKYFEIKKRKQRKIKLKRDMKKNPNKYHRKKSDPGIPNSAPFKIAVMNERDEYLKQKQREKEKRREQILKARKAMREAKVGEKKKLTDVINLENVDSIYEKSPKISTCTDQLTKQDEEKLVQDEEMDLENESSALQRNISHAEKLERLAQKSYESFRRKHNACKNLPQRPEPDSRFHNWSDRVYYRQVKQVVEASDVILQVVDARDPLGTRCCKLESLVRSKPGKRLVLVLNKADLVPKSNLEAWLKYLRAELPTVAFKAATKLPKHYTSALNRMVHIGAETLRTSKSMGYDVLIQLLKNYARSFPSSGIVVGVVGLPNVGKSSLINSLRKMKMCDVAPVPGCTKDIKEIKLDTKLRLLDCPGVVLPDESMSTTDAVLRNIVKLETVSNLVEVATEIFKRCDSLKLALFYGVRQVDNVEGFLSLLAKKSKTLLKHGITDQEAAARKLIYDWNHGNLKYYTEPPKRSSSDVSTELVKQLYPEFDLDTVAQNKEDYFLSLFAEGRPSQTMKLQPSAAVQGDIGGPEDNMDVCNDVTHHDDVDDQINEANDDDSDKSFSEMEDE